MSRPPETACREGMLHELLWNCIGGLVSVLQYIGTVALLYRLINVLYAFIIHRKQIARAIYRYILCNQYYCTVIYRLMMYIALFCHGTSLKNPSGVFQ